MAADLVLPGAPAEKVVVLPTGVDLAKLPFRAVRAGYDDGGAAPRVIAVGRFTAKKGLVDALDAFALLVRAHPGACLNVYGLGHIDEDAELVAAARARCAQEPLRGRVTLHQAVPHAVLVRALAQSDLFVCASRRAPDGDREGLPNAVKEAMAVGLPVVATAHGPLGALVLGEGAQDAAGLVVPEGDVAAMGEALCALASRRDEWPRFAVAGRRAIEARFELGAVVGALETLYDAVRGEHAGPG